MKPLSAEKFARAFASIQADLNLTEGRAVIAFRARRAIQRQAPEPTRREKHLSDSRNFKQTGAHNDSPSI